jgi:WD40 repeat protein
VNCRSLVRIPAAAFLAALSLSLVACSPGGGSRTATPGDGVATGTLGVIAYINTGGCIERVSASSGERSGQPYCAESRAGVTSVTWIDADSVAYATNESRAMGWQLVHFSTRASETMPIADAPRVFLIPPQYYSSKGERLAIDEDGVVSRADAEGDVRIFPPEGKGPDDSTRLVAWSPDGEWIVLSTSVDKELWVVSRTGESPHRIAESSKGVAAWFMPEVGATPHADLTCSVTTSQSFGCVTPLRLPIDGSTVNAGDGGSVDFSWSACPGATGYLFELYAAGAGAPVVSTIVVGTFSHQAVSGLPPGELRWRVRALIGASPAPWSEERVVTVLAAPKT